MRLADKKLNMPHEHTHIDTVADGKAKDRLRLSIVLTAAVLVAEVVGGYYTGSLALLSDAGHVFMDVFALSLSLFAIHISALPPTETRTYGLHRVEVFVSWVNSFVLIVITGFIFYEAYQRFFHPVPIAGWGMMGVAMVGLIANLIVAWWLKSPAKTDLNVKSAYFHVIGDAAASVGVIAVAVIIETTGWYAADPLISAAIGLTILAGAIRIMADASHILLEGVPKEIELNTVVSEMRASKGVLSVHSLHVWSICHNVYALSAHLDIEPTERWRTGEIFAEVNERLAQRHHIFYTTLQAECSRCDTNDIFGRIAHK
ncbi:MAG: cation transporter [Deltaproteobacteria bacterium]|nr:cation transporter [Deltaproteobacteria bacterium]